MPRDNFPKNIKDLLGKRVAYRCSNPDCRVSTTAAVNSVTDTESVTSIGVAAHIHAASVGGPRYCTEMTKDERRSINNGIWLCSNCSTAIDRDIGKYPASLLHQWKKEAEKTANHELGKKQPSERDALEQVNMALTGHPISFLPTAIENIHSASKQRLEAFDPRFQVETAYKNGVTEIEIHAREPILCEAMLQGKAAKEWHKKYTDIIDQGKTAQFNAKEISITGSKLIENIFDHARSNDSNITIIPHQKHAVAKIHLVDEILQKTIVLDDIHGFLILGKKSYIFKGNGFGEILKIEINIPRSQKNFRINFKVNFEKWTGRDVCDLPYFEKLEKLFTHLEKTSRINIFIEIEGHQILNIHIENNQKNEKIRSFFIILAYIKEVRKFSHYFTKKIHFKSQNIHKKDREDLIKILKITENKNFNDMNLTSFIALNDYYNNDIFLEQTTPINLIIPNYNLMIFGQQVVLEIRIHGVLPKILSDTSNIKKGDQVQVEWALTKNCEISCSLKKLDVS